MVMSEQTSSESVSPATHLYKDSLTDFYNKGFFEAEYGSRYGSGENSMMLVSCGNLDQVGDPDLVIVQIANLIKSNIRTTDFPCRWSQSQFVVLLPRTQQKESEEAGKRIAMRIINSSMQLDMMGSTLSIGIARADNDVNFASIFKNADWATYTA
jgi:diguanylate cyclase (GGDEF)-like protein